MRFSKPEMLKAKPGHHNTSSYIITPTGGAVAWSSKKQTTVALSTAEAKYIAGTHVAK